VARPNADKLLSFYYLIMNVLSLFDGISCGQLALEKAFKAEPENYFASEIEKNAILVTQNRFPNTKQLGDIKGVTKKTFRGTKIDLIMGGSPCQGFSVAGKLKNFDDPRSQLFFEYARLLQELQPKYFLLENVKMDKDSMRVITDELGVEPKIINSAYYSAQNRERSYWTNIPLTEKKEPDKTVLQDILEKDLDKSSLWRRQHHETQLQYFPVDKGGEFLHQVGFYKKDKQGWRIYGVDGKSPTLTAESGGLAGPGNTLIMDGKSVRRLSIIEAQRLQTIPDGYTDGIPLSRQHNAIGNGWTVNVIAHIFKGIKL
jgi:DNA-cytosine methyltransferase